MKQSEKNNQDQLLEELAEQLAQPDESLQAEQFEQTNSLIWFENAIDINNRRIMLVGDIDQEIVGKISRAMMSMIDRDDSAPIDIFISSFGGSVYDGFALYDLIEVLQQEVGILIRTHAIGKVMSMAFIIFLAGNERYSFPRATFMHHETSDSVDGKTHELHESMHELNRINELILDILEARTKKSRIWWKKQQKAVDMYIDPKNAKRLGIITA